MSIQYIVAIVPAAGTGKRFGQENLKTYFDIEGIPLLVHTLKSLQAQVLINQIILSVRSEDIEHCRALTKQHELHKVTQIVPGGNERQDSIYNALQELKCPEGISRKDIVVLIHDGARPIIPGHTIESLLEGIKGVEGAIPGVTARDTLKTVDSEGIVISTVNRESFRAIQTPQAFRLETILSAYETAGAESFYATDDAALVEKAGGRVRVITGSPLNIKVTTPEDIGLVTYLLHKGIS
ncbi:MAG: 2-C-methyl-D-erythritol 4-phosphate cytidylyltransferase [Nitrospira sp.]|nr:2-C-methyl-D-erythritol 4-phosphate cytidylyltransferase [bacterium]MBL7048711.1 2-C-methyl-D-erythritol 4-phosphate cytidylyltransferase [Nitrospira sp.]